MKLSDLYPLLSADERQQLAVATETSSAYLWQLATRWRGRRPSLELMRKLAAADERLTMSDLVDEFSAPVEKGAAHA